LVGGFIETAEICKNLLKRHNFLDEATKKSKECCRNFKIMSVCLKII